MITIGTNTFKTQEECKNFVRQILIEMEGSRSVRTKNAEYFNFLYLLCERHPDYDAKFQNFSDFQISRNALNLRGLALNIVNKDGSLKEISWCICVTGKCKTPESLFRSALRQCISNQTMDFKNTSDLSYCRECNCDLGDKIIHIDHYEKQFLQLVNDFLDENKERITVPTEYDKKKITFETLFKSKDAWIGKLFETYHLENATLRVLCEPCNLKRKKYKK